MRFMLEYPVAHASYSKEFLDPEVMSAVAVNAEKAGFAAIGFTDHPAPSDKWMRAGGHESLDPFSALAFCAAVTTRLRLMTFLLVAPYRNPLLIAKCAATVDVLSKGRLVLALGAGYLRSEFAALGVDFADRNDLLDEAVAAMTGIWSNDAFSFEGRHFNAIGQTARPRPVQQPVPMWFGGNSVRARKRAARAGHGWAPLMNDATAATTNRTALLDTPRKLAAAVEQLREFVVDEDRDPAAVEVQVETPQAGAWASAESLERHRDHLGELSAVGVTSFVVKVPGDDPHRAIDALNRYGNDVIAAC
ncbi:MAG TPA: LLM class F420-dependent oxidoreductase [Mycobacterium sp.]|nr:LLM class F420-dependent oxidoreductase [Mycobacterium sp.]